MRTHYRVEGKTVRLEMNNDVESIVLELRTCIAKSRTDRDDLPFMNSNYGRAIRTGPGRSSSSSHVASVAGRPGISEVAAAGIQRHRCKLSD